MDEYTHLKDTIKDLIKKGKPTKYTEEYGWRDTREREK